MKRIMVALVLALGLVSLTGVIGCGSGSSTTKQTKTS